MPPGSPGIFRRKSSTLDEATLSSHFPRNDAVDSLKMSGQHVPWPNTKEDYDLKEIIGKLIVQPQVSHLTVRDFLTMNQVDLLIVVLILWSPRNNRPCNLSFLLHNKHRINKEFHSSRCWSYCCCTCCILQTKTRKMCNKEDQPRKMEYKYGRIIGKLLIYSYHYNLKHVYYSFHPFFTDDKWCCCFISYSCHK